MKDLIVLCPSYKRPKAAAELLVSEWDTTRKAELRFLVWDQDPTCGLYPQANTVLIPEETMVARTNAGARMFMDQARYLGWVADDMRFRSNDWKSVVVDALDRMGGGVVFGNDLRSPGEKPAHVFLSSEIVRALGWLHHPGMRATFGDDVWEYLGREMRRYRYLPEVVVEHLYSEKDNIPDFLHDMEVFQDWIHEQADVDAARCLREMRRGLRSRPSSSTSMACSSTAITGTPKPSRTRSESTATTL